MASQFYLFSMSVLSLPMPYGDFLVLYASKILICFQVGLSIALAASPVSDGNSYRNFNRFSCFGVY